MRLLVLSHFFPHTGAEPFLVYESQYFNVTSNSVLIAPLFGSGTAQHLQLNHRVLPPVLTSPKSRLQLLYKGLFNFKSFSYHRSDFFKHWWKQPKTWYSVCLSILVSRAIRASSNYQQLIHYINAGGPVIVYSYWADHWTSVLPYLKDSCSTSHYKIVIRSHGSDLTGVHQQGYRPFRAEVLQHCTAWYAVSEYGKLYLQTRYPEFKFKIKCARIGVPGHGKAPLPNVGQPLTFISVSNIVPLKRVHLIFEVFQNLNHDIIWHHFGDGPEMPRLKQKIKSARPAFKVHLHGHVETDALVSFYKTQPVHAFINLSTREGLPVSIMEAFSFGIPVFATAVGGTPELVNDTNGSCIPAEVTDTVLQNALEAFVLRISNSNDLRQQAYITWLNKVSTENYIHFFNELKAYSSS